MVVFRFITYLEAFAVLLKTVRLLALAPFVVPHRPCAVRATCTVFEKYVSYAVASDGRGHEGARSVHAQGRLGAIRFESGVGSVVRYYYLRPG